MPKKATAADAELILKLYELRREPEMRKARNWWMNEFWPESADDFITIAMSFPSQENQWMRQAATYWEMEDQVGRERIKVLRDRQAAFLKRRAASSIPSNIAEGFGRDGDADSPASALWRAVRPANSNINSFWVGI